MPPARPSTSATRRPAPPLPMLLLLISLLLALLTACAAPASTISSTTSSTPNASTTNAARPTCAQPTCALAHTTIFVEPDAKATPLLRAIRAAHSSIFVEVYLLTDTTIIYALEDAAQRGLDVRLLLETHPYGGGDTQAQQLIAELRAAGIHAQPASPLVHYTHEKTLILDHATALILTCNLTRSGLGAATPSNREYGVIDTDPTDVAAASAIFQADWNHTIPNISDPRLLVSPLNARAGIAALLASAQRHLLLEDEEMADPASEATLIAAAQRGVSVQIVLPAPTTSAPNPDVARLLAGGVSVRYLTTPYMHAKLILIDTTLAFIGSENVSTNSLDANRELGVILADPQALATLATVSSQDWALAQPA